MPHPLLEIDNVECPHKGKVMLDSSNKDLLKVDNAGVVTIDDLRNANIVGCTNSVAGVPSPCTKLANIPDSIASSLLQVNNQKVILAESISQALTDKGFPLVLQGSPKSQGILEIE